jgi:cysteine desulfurase/selenocysteine lyase
MKQALEGLKEVEGIEILGSSENRSNLVTFNLRGIHPLDAATLLDLKGIAVRSGHLCAQPLLKHFSCTAALRLSLAPYNTSEEIGYFCDSLQNMLNYCRV